MHWAHRPCSERHSKPKLHHPRLIREGVAECRPPEIRVAFIGHIRSVVCVVEQVEHFKQAVGPYAEAERNPLLDPHIHAVNRIGDQ